MKGTTEVAVVMRLRCETCRRYTDQAVIQVFPYYVCAICNPIEYFDLTNSIPLRYDDKEELPTIIHVEGEVSSDG